MFHCKRLNSIQVFQLAFTVCAAISQKSVAQEAREQCSNNESSFGRFQESADERSPMLIDAMIDRQQNEHDFRLIKNLKDVQQSLRGQAGERDLHLRGPEGLRQAINRLKIQSFIYGGHLLAHKHDSLSEAKLLAGPKVDEELCLSQLKTIIDQSNSLMKEGSSSTNIHVGRFLSGSDYISPTRRFESKIFAIGFYEESKTFRGETPDRVPNEGRYCIASIKRIQFSRDEKYLEHCGPVAAAKVGLLLPKSCDSLEYKNKFELLTQLLRHKEYETDKGETKVIDLYCLPDSESTLRNPLHSPGAVIFIGALSVWIGVLVYSTIKFNELQRGDGKGINKFETAADQTYHLKLEHNSTTNFITRSSIYRCLSISNNLRVLFGSTDDYLAHDFNELGLMEKADDTDERDNVRFANFGALDGIKMVCVMFIITNESIVGLSSITDNAIDLHSKIWSHIVLHSGSLIAVNSLITIAGLLTSYLMLKREVKVALTNWTPLIAFRYMRTALIYLVVVLYLKLVSKYLGHGPLWDYGTSELAQRRTCERESLLWTALMGANFKSPLDHCVPYAWYLANEFQFFLLAPFIMLILRNRPNLGIKILKFGIALGFLASVEDIYKTNVEDIRPNMSRSLAQSFKVYIKLLSSNYTHPHLRMPAYLCGILFGYILRKLEVGKLKDEPESASPTGDCFVGVSSLKSYAGFIVTLLAACCCLQSVVNSGEFYHTKLASPELLIAIVVPLIQVLTSVAVAMFILLASTGRGNKHLVQWLESGYWKPLSKLSLCAILIHSDVTRYLTQNLSFLLDSSEGLLVARVILHIFMTYLTSTFLYVLLEAPIVATLTNLISNRKNIITNEAEIVKNKT